MQVRHVKRALFLVLVVALVATAGATASQSGVGAFPGKNGRIVFNDQSGNLILVNPDGSGVVRLARTQASDYAIGASFSRDGTQIAYSAAAGPTRTCS
jgi:hypothetical protein